RIAQTTAGGALALVLWMAISGALSHPDYLAYFNEFAGREPEKILVDAYLEFWPGLPKIKPIQPAIPAEGWTAVSPTIDKTTQYGLYFRYPTVQPWFDSLTPSERVG